MKKRSFSSSAVLKNLTHNLNDSEKAKQLIEDYLIHADNSLYQAVMDTITRANQRTFEAVNGMSDIFMEIVQEKFDKKLKEETEKAVEKAVKREKETTKLTERISLIQKKCVKNKPLTVIADELESSPDEILPFYNLVSENPGKTPEEIYELISG